MTKWAHVSTDLLFYAQVGMHQVRILVFDNITKRVQSLNVDFTSIFSTVDITSTFYSKTDTLVVKPQ